MHKAAGQVIFPTGFRKKARGFVPKVMSYPPRHLTFGAPPGCAGGDNPHMGANNLTYSKDGLHLTECFEGDILTAYKDQRGVWTIGYGHTGYIHPGMTITQRQAEALLDADIQTAVRCVNDAVDVPLTQPQFDSLVDFAFNVGITSFRHSTLLKEVNAGNFPQALAQFNLWDHCGGVVNAGLLRRRRAEAGEFADSLPPAAGPVDA